MTKGKKKKEGSDSPTQARFSKKSAPVRDTVDLFTMELQFIKPWHSLCLIFALGLGIRLLYLQQFKSTPLQQVAQWDNSDMYFFDAWAKQLASGDWSNDQPFHPVHTWHKDLANEYFRQNPGKLAEYKIQAASAGLINPERALINQWYGGKTYHQEPLYAYLIAATYAIFGVQQEYVFWWQLLLGAVNGVLVFAIGKKLFGNMIGILSALLFLLSPMVLFFDLVLLRTTLSSSAMLLLLFSFIRLRERSTIISASIFGISMGLAFMVQTYLILFTIPALMIYLFENRSNLRTTFSKLGLAVGICLLFISPFAIRNISKDISAFKMASNGGITYIPANHVSVDPTIAFTVQYSSLAKIMGETGGAILPSILASIQSYPSFGAFLELQWTKLKESFYWFEMQNNVNVYLYQLYIPVLRYLPITMLICAPFGLLGMFFVFRRYRWEKWPLYLILLVSLVPLLFSVPLSRYRSGFLIVLILFSSFAILQTLQYLQSKKWANLASTLVALSILFALTLHGRERPAINYDYEDYAVLYGNCYRARLSALEGKKDWQNYALLTEEFIEHCPPEIDEYLRIHQIKSVSAAQVSKFVSSIYIMHAHTLELLNRPADAKYYQDKGLRLEALAQPMLSH